MIPASSLRFLDEGRAGDEADVAPKPPGEPAAPEPRVFVRSVSAPAGWPWEQRRNVDLEARYGAPLPIAELLYRVRRLEAWRPGAPSRFAIFYVQARDVRGRLDADAEVDGKPVTVTFGAAGEAGVQAGRTLGRTVVVAGLVVLVVWSIAAALNRRAETGAALQLAEQRAESKLKAAEARQRLRDQAHLLDLELDRGAPLRDVVADLGWASNAKNPDARIEALHWDHGLLAVEARGQNAPFGLTTDRRIERSKRPVRPGVWLWGVTGGSLPTGASGVGRGP